MNALRSLMMNFQSIDAVPDLNDRFVFKETSIDLQTQNGLNVFPSLPVLSESTLQGAAPIQTIKASQAPQAFFNQNRGTIFTPQERERLVGHLVGRDPSSLVLTPRQRQALEEEIRLRSLVNGVETFSGNKASTHQSISLNIPFKRPALRFFDDEVKSNKFAEPVLPNLVLTNSESRPQSPIRISDSPKHLGRMIENIMSNEDRVGKEVKSVPDPQLTRQNSPQPSLTHPSILLNSLRPDEQQLFLAQFLSLNPEQQEFTYRKLLSAGPEVQEFAIQQFLTLNNQVLIVSLQSEIEREKILEGKQLHQIGRDSPGKELAILQAEATSLGSLTQMTTSLAQSLNPDQLSVEELRALQEQRQLEEQQKQLQAIIETQNLLNRRG